MGAIAKAMGMMMHEYWKWVEKTGARVASKQKKSPQKSITRPGRAKSGANASGVKSASR
jgi:hypothetical protein